MSAEEGWILANGRIYPRLREETTREGLVIRDGRVVTAFDGPPSPDVARLPVVDLGDRVVLPGLTDAHIHLQKYSQQLQLVDCETTSLEECLRRVEARARRAGPEEWILGHGWNQNDWAGFGTAADLDRVCAGRPAYLTAKSLHAGWANREALRRAGISNATPDPPGGRIQRNSKGSPTGILLESAMSLVADAIPATPLESVVESIRSAQERLWRSGLTGVHDFDGPVSFQALQILLERGQLDLRVLKSIPHDRLGETAALGLRSGFGNSRLWVGHVKLFADGALGPRTAAMLAPYDGEPDNTGYLMLDREAVLERGMRAAEAGLGLAIHAIGDRANHEVLEGLTALRRYESEHGLPRRRHRIEHVQLLHPDDVPRLAALGVVASMQPVHATSDMTMADRYWGRRSAYGYAWHSQMQAGATLAFGSDAPVESPDPFLGLHAAVTRRRRDGTPSTEGWIPAERLSIREALSAYSEGPAFAAGRETKLGRLDSGSYADLVVLDRDPFRIPVDDLLEIKVLATMVGGRWVLREF